MINLDGIFMSSSGQPSSGLPSFNELIASLDAKSTKEQLIVKLEAQFQFNKISVKHIYSQSYPSHMILNRQECELLIDLYEKSEDSSYMIKPNTSGQVRVYKLNGNEVISTKKFIKILTRSPV